MGKGVIWATAEDLARNRGKVLSLYRQILRGINSPDLPLTFAARLAKKAEIRAIFLFGSEEKSLHNIADLIDAAEYSLSVLNKNTSVIDDAASEVDLNTKNALQITTESDTDTESKDISVKLLLNKANNKVLCAEVGEDMVDLVFSFLTFPLGSVIKLLGSNSSMGCVDNLYRSVQGLSSDYIESEEWKSMLLSPKIAPFFGCSNQLLKMDEMSPKEGSVRGCYTCYLETNMECIARRCKHGVERAVLGELNPKSPEGKAEKGGGYAKRSRKFLVTDDLCVSPLSLISAIQIINSPDTPFNKIVEGEANIGKVQALNLLRAALFSKTPLSDVFSGESEAK